eukprot:NODE_4919_length_1831_cov_2.484155.p1 GENE.NODE_4919_length_1831_cov_2.484155~~NODE_4919_length_1831_cov_2.484155.p1  ORF type:complete len:610 (+),score=174.23 NODE_4919_length_1831_cov_2.484155:178-1830(+)
MDYDAHVLEPAVPRWSTIAIAGGLSLPPFALAAAVAVGPDTAYLFGGAPNAGFLRLRLLPAQRAAAASASTAADAASGSDNAAALQLEMVLCELHGEAPSQRFCHGMAAVADRWLVLFGGTENQGLRTPRTLNDCYLLDLRCCGASQPRVHCKAVVGETAPPERNGFTMIGAGTKFIVFGGGVHQEAYYNDMWVLDLQMRPNVVVPSGTSGMNFSTDFAWLLEDEAGLALADLTLVVGGAGCTEVRRSFEVHRAVLCARSVYFRALLAGSFREGSGECRQVALPDLDPDIFEVVLSYIYTGLLPTPEPESPDDWEARARAPLDRELIACVLAGDPPAVARALAAGADPDAREKDTRRTPAHLLAMQENDLRNIPDAAMTEIVALLASARADLTTVTDAYGHTPMKHAGCRRNRAFISAVLADNLQRTLAADAATDTVLEVEKRETGEDERAGEGKDEGNPLIEAVLGVVLCADRLNLPHLAILCERWLARALRPSNVCELLEVADELQRLQLRLLCIHFLKRWNWCHRSPAFAALPQHLREEVAWARECL